MSRAAFLRGAAVGIGVGATVAVASCSLVLPLDDHTTAITVDGALGDSEDTADAGSLRVTVTPTLVAIAPGDPPATVQVDVHVNDGSSAPVAVTVSGGAAGVSASVPAPVAAGGTTSFTMTVDATSTVRGDIDFAVEATQAERQASARLHLRVVGILVPDAAGGLDVHVLEPAIVLIKAWGAGGGAGLGPFAPKQGLGGGGGFASAQFEIASSTHFAIVEGVGGVGAVSLNGGAGGGIGGGGGGFSGVAVAGTWWLIAGGGGGGGSEPDQPGGGGGGLAGQPSFAPGSVGPCYGGGGGTQVAGGAVHTCSGGDERGQAGGALTGGAGGLVLTRDGGAGSSGGPGGLSTDTNYCGGGGGGGGWFGGAGGSENANSGGGGGGSGYVLPTVRISSLVPGGSPNSFDPAAVTDSDYGSGNPGRGGASTSEPGRNGRVVVRLVKP